MKHLLVHLKLLFVAAVWGFGWPAGRVLAEEMAPFAAAWTRYVVALACFAALLFFTNNWVFPTRGEWKRIASDWFLFNGCVSSVFHVRNAVHSCW